MTKLEKPKGSVNTPLLVLVKDGKLMIQIGIETLEWASRFENGGVLKHCKVDEKFLREWAEDVARAMRHEDELGESPLMRFLDEMMKKVADGGSASLSYNREDLK